MIYWFSKNISHDPQQLDFLCARSLSIAEATKNWNLCIEALQTPSSRPRISASFGWEKTMEIWNRKLQKKNSWLAIFDHYYNYVLLFFIK